MVACRQTWCWRRLEFYILIRKQQEKGKQKAEKIKARLQHLKERVEAAGLKPQHSLENAEGSRMAVSLGNEVAENGD